MELNLFKDWIKSINEKDKYIDNVDELSYPAFLINRAMSQYPDTALVANEINQRSILNKQLQYDFYYFYVPKKKRCAKWFKQTKHDDIINIMKVYGISYQKALEVIQLFDENDLKKISEYLYEGGCSK